MPAIIIVAALAFASIVALWLMKLSGEAQVATQEPGAAALHADKDNKESSLPVGHEDSGAPSAHSDATKAGSPKDQNLQSSVQTGAPPDQPLLDQRGQADALPKPQEPIKPSATTVDQTAKVPLGQTTEERQNRNIEAKPPTGQAALAETPKQLQVENLKGELPPCGSSQAPTGSSTSLETNLASRDKDVQLKEQSMGKQLQPEQTSGTTLPTAAGQQSSQSPEPSSGSPVQGGEGAFKKSEESNLDKKKFPDDKSTMQTAQTITQNDLAVGEDQKKNLKLVADEKQQQHLITAQEKTKDKEAPFSEDKPRGKSETAAQMDIATYTAKLDSEIAGDASSADKGTTAKITVTQVIRLRDEKTIIADGVATQETESLIEKNQLIKQKPFVINRKVVQTTGRTNLAKPLSYTGSKAESSGKTATMAVDTAKLDTEKVFEEEEASKEMRNVVSGEKVTGLEEPNTKSNKPNGAEKAVIAEQVLPSLHKESAIGNIVETTATPISEPIEQQPAHVEVTIVKPEETASLISITATVVTDKNNDWMLAEMEEMMKEDIIMQDLQKLGMDSNPAINQPQGDQSMRTAVDTISESKSSNSQNQK